MKITIKKIAELSGYSTGTVGRVLHNNGYVKKETREKILSVCEKYNYKKNHIGKAMVMQKKQTLIAVIISDPTISTFSKQVYDGFCKINDQWIDYNIAFKYYLLNNNTVNEMLDILKEVSKTKVSGIIIKPLDSSYIASYINTLFPNIPIVTCITYLDKINNHICYVGQDHYRAGRIAANLVTKMNSSCFNIIILSESLEINDRKKKLEGFLSFLNENNINYNILEKRIINQNSNDVSQEIEKIILKNPTANILYMSPFKLNKCLEKLKSIGFNGLSFTFGTKSVIQNYLLNNIIDFAIYEKSFEIGYIAGKTMLEYIIFNTTHDNIIINDEIAIQTNCM